MVPTLRGASASSFSSYSAIATAALQKDKGTLTSLYSTSIAEGGEFPTTVSSLRKVRGTGDYTSGAIASIAFKEVVPVVDGNVIRAISRLKAISANPKESTTVKSFWKLAGQFVDPSRRGDFNQALMELRATVCTPLSPSCSACPISDQCHAMSVSSNCQTVQVTDFPMKVA